MGRRARARELEAQLTDDLIERYVAWREACAAAAAAYARWGAASEDRRLAYYLYRAALDLEQHAAAGYRHAAGRVVAGLSSCERGAAAPGGAPDPGTPSGARSA